MSTQTVTACLLALAALCGCGKGDDDRVDCLGYEGLECAGPQQRATHFDPACSRIECCPGTTATDFLIPTKTWAPTAANQGLPAGCTLEHGQNENVLCVACGDGVCDKDALETWCVCPKDCPEWGHNPCAAVEKKVADCGLPRFDRSTCLPYTECPINCMLAASCDELAKPTDAAMLNGCLSNCHPESACIGDGAGIWLSTGCERCPDARPKEGSACGISAHAGTCNYPNTTPQDKPYDSCNCEGWKWHCI